VVINAVAPPLSDSVFIPYTWSTLGAEENQKVLEEIIMWSRAVGANTIRMETRDIDKFHRYGFKEVATVMELKI
jgi:hypothetical protein